MPQEAPDTLGLPPMFANSPDTASPAGESAPTVTYEVAAARALILEKEDLPAATVEVAVSPKLLTASRRDDAEVSPASEPAPASLVLPLHIPAGVTAPKEGSAPQEPGPAGKIRVPSPLPPLPLAVGEISLPTTPSPPAKADEGTHSTRLWDEPPRKRKLPMRVRLGLGALVAIVALAFGASRLGGPKKTQVPEKLALRDDLVIHADDLKDRREVTEDDFRSREPEGLFQAPADESVDARRQRRSTDPEDLLTLKRKSTRAPQAPRGATPSRAGQSDAQPPLALRSNGARQYPPPFVSPLVRANPFSADAPFRYPIGGVVLSPKEGEDSAQPRERLAAAGTSVSAVLLTPVRLRRGSTTTVVATALAGPFPKGTRFLGTASTSDESRLLFTFRRLVLPDGQEIPIDAQAQDADGLFGLSALVEGQDEGDTEEGTAAKRALQETAKDVMLGALGTGIAGQAADNYLDAKRDERQGRRPRRGAFFELPSGVEFTLFLTQGVAPKRAPSQGRKSW